MQRAVHALFNPPKDEELKDNVYEDISLDCFSESVLEVINEELARGRRAVEQVELAGASQPKRTREPTYHELLSVYHQNFHVQGLPEDSSALQLAVPIEQSESAEPMPIPDQPADQL